MNYTLEWLPAVEQHDIEGEPFDVWRSLDGDVSTMFRRIEQGFHVRFNHCADFEINLTTGNVSCTPVPDIPKDYCECIFTNQILPLLWTYEGTPVLHASGVLVDGEAIVFLGPSGRGKSTLAASFSLAGYPFLTDDGVIVRDVGERCTVEPYLSSIRLLPDSQEALLGVEAPAENADGWSTKVRFKESSQMPYHSSPTTIRAIYTLKPPAAEQVEIEALAQIPAVDALLQHSFLLDWMDKKRVTDHFKSLAKLAECTPVFALDYPRDYAKLDAVIETIVSHARNEGGRL